MTTFLEAKPTDIPNEPRLRMDQDIFSTVKALLGGQNVRPGLERRREQRFPYPYPIRLTPVTTDGAVAPAETVVVLGKHLNEHGVDFYFKEPLPYRRVIASFDCNGRETVHLLIELTWCRFGRHGWYENGGRFLQVVPGCSSAPAATTRRGA